MRRLVGLFPANWRRRYGNEFEALLEEGGLSTGDVLDLMRGALDARLNPQPHLVDGGHEMAPTLKRRVLGASAAVALLVVMVFTQSVWTSAFPRSRQGVYPPSVIDLVLPPSQIGPAVQAAIFGAIALALWRLGRLRPIWILCGLIAARTAEGVLVWAFLGWSAVALPELDSRISPLGYGWLLPTLVIVLAGVALVALLARALRLRLVTAIVIGLALEMAVGDSDLSLLRYLGLHGLDELLTFFSPAGRAQIARPNPVAAIWDPLPYLSHVGPVIWALALQQIALRTADAAGPRRLGQTYVAFARAHWAPIAVVIVVVALARFALPQYLQSDAVTNPTKFVPTGTDVHAQYLACLKTYGIDLPADTNTKKASIPNGPAQRCGNIINTYPQHAKGTPLSIPAPVTANGVTYTVTWAQIAGSSMRIDWTATGEPLDRSAAVIYPPRPPSRSQRADDPSSPLYQFELLHRQFLQAAVRDAAGNLVHGPGGGGGLSRSKPTTYTGQIFALVPGPGQYTVQFGCASPPPTAGQPLGDPRCTGEPLARVTVTVP